MKFHTAFAQAKSQNAFLKIALCLSSVAVLALALCLTQVSAKPPIVVERSCNSKMLKAVDGKHSSEEITAFLKEALAERFNNDTQNNHLISPKELKLKEQEQKELQSRQLKQLVIVQSVKVEEKQITVEADRLISVGEVRSAFNFPLQVAVEATNRSESNPYGLILTKISPLKQETKNE